MEEQPRRTSVIWLGRPTEHLEAAAPLLNLYHVLSVSALVTALELQIASTVVIDVEFGGH